MAPPTSTNLAARAPQRANPVQLLIIAIGIPLGIAVFLFGLYGVVVMRDPDATQWYSQLPAAALWRRLVAKNPFYLTSEDASVVGSQQPASATAIP